LVVQLPPFSDKWIIYAENNMTQRLERWTHAKEVVWIEAAELSYSQAGQPYGPDDMWRWAREQWPESQKELVKAEQFSVRLAEIGVL
jgi:hypothetical protein